MATKSSDCATHISSDGGNTDSSKQERVNNKYFDVLLLGKTGMGKSTTGNKLINSKSANPVIYRWSIEGEDKCLPDQSGGPKCFKEGSEESTATTTTICDLLSEESGELDGPKFRVLDVQGFATNQQTDISILQQVEKFQQVLDLEFSRIVYFLPIRGRLQKADYNILEEINLLKDFFGTSIFDSMIVVYTEDPRGSVRERTEEKVERSKEAFSHVLRGAIGQAPGYEYPNPPIVFLPHSATPDEARKLIKCTNVKCNSFKLQFCDGTCHRCGLKFTSRRVDGKIVGVTCTTDEGVVSYDKTKCHPIFVTKYTKFEQFASNLMHVSTLGLTHCCKKGLGLPGFGWLRSSEWCPCCQKTPHSSDCIPGCHPVQQVYEYTSRQREKCSILVHHSDKDAES